MSIHSILFGVQLVETLIKSLFLKLLPSLQMITVIVEIQKIWLWIEFIHSFWRQKQLQARKIIQISGKPCMFPLQMNTWKQLLLKLKFWKQWMHGSLLTTMKVRMLFNQLGPESWNFFLIDLSKSSKHGYVMEEVSRFKASISLKHMLLLFNEQQFA